MAETTEKKGNNNTQKQKEAYDDAADLFVSILAQELMELEGIHMQNPETGANIRGKDNITSYLGKYTNRVFGAPFQLLDSVDKRFPKINKYLGNEYMRNFILNSPILHIKPGMPKYTGGADGNSLFKAIGEVYFGTNDEMSFGQNMLLELAKGTLFGAGSKLQKRMYGFRETYYQYNQHVNYMCRSMATFLGLTDTNFLSFDGTRYSPTKITNTDDTGSTKVSMGVGIYPNGAFPSYKSNGFTPFATFKWENYRMLEGSTVLSPFDMLKKLCQSHIITQSIESICVTLGFGAGWLASGVGFAADTLGNGFKAAIQAMTGQEITLQEDVVDSIQKRNEEMSDTIAARDDVLGDIWSTSMTDVMADKICSVQFMVEPGSFEETLTNEAQQSQIAATIESTTGTIGNEIGFITNSKVDGGLIGSLASFLGNTVETAATFVSGIVEPIAGGFASNLITGAVSGLRGQKMIYPDIYSNSRYESAYNFTVNLSSPYGDVYNYYMNIVVPLCHLICLTAPRMVTANTVQSPYLVQAYIPGMITIQLGMIQNMVISKNPNISHVSVNGFPLDVKVTFSILQLYHSMAISPANDPASFLFNETLNDYMANLAGLMPAIDTYTQQRKAAFDSLDRYFSQGEFWNDISNTLLEKVEDLSNPFIQSGS